MANEALVQAWLDRRRRIALDGEVDVDTADPLNPGTVSGAALREELAGSGLSIVEHGDNADEPRPEAAAAVYWIGTVQPAAFDETRDIWNGPAA